MVMLFFLSSIPSPGNATPSMSVPFCSRVWLILTAPCPYASAFTTAMTCRPAAMRRANAAFERNASRSIVATPVRSWARWSRARSSPTRCPARVSARSRSGPDCAGPRSVSRSNQQLGALFCARRDECSRLLSCATSWLRRSMYSIMRRPDCRPACGPSLRCSRHPMRTSRP